MTMTTTTSTTVDDALPSPLAIGESGPSRGGGTISQKTSMDVTRPTTAVGGEGEVDEDAKAPMDDRALVEDAAGKKKSGFSLSRGGKVDFGFLPIRPALRYDPDKPIHFGVLLNAIFGFASTFGAIFSFFLLLLLFLLIYL